ncbi:Serine proteases trypsin domain [Trinorchestia longiramus]|nr:Serine proteases trypsin domain [Trinorchestia longiramus]
MTFTYISVCWVVLVQLVYSASVTRMSEDDKFLAMQTLTEASEFKPSALMESTVHREEELMDERRAVTSVHEEDYNDEGFFPRGRGFFDSNIDERVKIPRATFTDTCTCGQKLTRIVGGHETHVSEYPWQVAVVNSATGRQFCGGSLLTDSHILSAAHCFIVNREAHAEDREAHAEDREAHTEDREVHAESGEVHAEDREAHTEDREAHIEDSEVLTESRELHTESGEVHTEDHKV